jgi:hypothetical protein
MSGAVSFRTSADTKWSDATVNFPVSMGDAFWTATGGKADLEVAASRVGLDAQTELDVTVLDDTGMQAVVPQGEVYLHLADLAPNEEWLLQTPRGMVRLNQAGRYDIMAGAAGEPTLVTVLEGSAEIAGPGFGIQVGAEQTATITGSGQFQVTMGPAKRDAFLSGELAAERPPANDAAPPPRLSYFSGEQDLSAYGEWSQSPDLGDVWYPNVPANWVPYRDGVWAYVAPWGWTWIDADPWGFAPFHYGRWARLDGRWAWAPGDRASGAQPVYAPALVTFLGRSNGGTVSWVPLGPGEVYHPWYPVSDYYRHRLDASLARGSLPAGDPGAFSGFVNRDATTSVPDDVVRRSLPVRAAFRAEPGAELADARPIGQPALLPTLATIGVTEALAHRLNLPGERRRGAAGPVVHPGEAGRFPAMPPLLGSRPGRASPVSSELTAPEPDRGRPGSAFEPGERRPGLYDPLGLYGPREQRPGGMFAPREARPSGIYDPKERPGGMFEPRDTRSNDILQPGERRSGSVLEGDTDPRDTLRPMEEERLRRHRDRPPETVPLVVRPEGGAEAPRLAEPRPEIVPEPRRPPEPPAPRVISVAPPKPLPRALEPPLRVEQPRVQAPPPRVEQRLPERRPGERQ